MLVRFEELTDDNQWKLLVVPSIPAPAHTDRPRVDDRSIIIKWSITGIWKNIMNFPVSRGIK
jgi:hypothetical protein